MDLQVPDVHRRAGRDVVYGAAREQMIRATLRR
jgi:hypothetical protein